MVDDRVCRVEYMRVFNELERLRSRMITAEQLLRRHSRHHECDDSFYSCPKHPEYIGNDDRTHCDCGADEVREFLGLSHPPNQPL